MTDGVNNSDVNCLFYFEHNRRNMNTYLCTAVLSIIVVSRLPLVLEANVTIVFDHLKVIVVRCKSLHTCSVANIDLCHGTAALLKLDQTHE